MKDLIILQRSKNIAFGQTYIFQKINSGEDEPFCVDALAINSKKHNRFALAFSSTETYCIFKINETYKIKIACVGWISFPFFCTGYASLSTYHVIVPYVCFFIHFLIWRRPSCRQPIWLRRFNPALSPLKSASKNFIHFGTWAAFYERTAAPPLFLISSSPRFSSLLTHRFALDYNPVAVPVFLFHPLGTYSLTLNTQTTVPRRTNSKQIGLGWEDGINQRVPKEQSKWLVTWYTKYPNFVT